jgi:hypothetical protein
VLEFGNFAVVALDHHLESQLSEQLSGLGFLRAGESKVVLESTEGEEKLGLVFWASAFGDGRRFHNENKSWCERGSQVQPISRRIWILDGRGGIPTMTRGGVVPYHARRGKCKIGSCIHC